MNSQVVYNTLSYRYNERFDPEDRPEEIKQGEYIEKKQRGKIICPEEGCREKCKVVDSDEKKLVCRKGHINEYDKSIEYYFEVQTGSAIKEVIEEMELEGTRRREEQVYTISTNSDVIIIVPGDFRERLIQNVGQFLREKRNVCIISFQKETKRELNKLIERFGGISMVITPPNLQEKLLKFEALVELRDSVEAEYIPSESTIPNDLISKVHDNPQYLIGELVDYNKINKSKKERERQEKLIAVALSQLMDFPMKSMGTEQRGERVPDGFGYLFEDSGANEPLIIVDSKSVSSKNRNYPIIDESDDAQYRMYLEKGLEINQKYGGKEQLLMFVAPEYKLSKLSDFLNELRQSDIEGYRTIFAQIDGIIALLIYKQSLAFDRKTRFDESWRDLIYSLLTDPAFEKKEKDYKLSEKDAELLDVERVKQHFESKIPKTHYKDEVINDVEEMFLEINL